MRRLGLIVLLIVFSTIRLFAKDGVNIDMYGFVHNQMFLDDRKSLQAAQGLYNVIPLDIKEDVEGNDLNQQMDLTFLSITSRIGMNLSGPEFLGASATGKIEADFSASSGTTPLFMLRQANFVLNWDKFRWLIGQTWHPMSGEIIPEVIGISMGSPFNPFNRSPQLRVDYYLFDKKQLTLTAAYLYQGQYASYGPEGRNNKYQRAAVTPASYLGVSFQTGGFKVGIGAEVQTLVPRTTAFTGTPNEVKVDESIITLSGMIQASYVKDKLSLKTKTVWGEDMSHLGICSGYGVDAIHQDLVTRDYHPLTAVSSWVMGTYGKEWKVGLFGGYMSNLGSTTNYISESMMYVYGGTHIDKMYRVSPSISYNVANLQFAVEYERTSVAYGTMKGHGNVVDSHWVTNNRLLFSTSYNF